MSWPCSSGVADTPRLAGACNATSAVSEAGSCSVSGVTPGSIMSTAAGIADAAQCSVRGAFATKGEECFVFSADSFELCANMELNRKNQ